MCYFLGPKSVWLLLKSKCCRMKKVSVLRGLCLPSLWGLPHHVQALPSGLCPLAAVWFLVADQRAGGGGEGGTDQPTPFLLNHRWAEAPFPKAAGLLVAGSPTVTVMSLSLHPRTTPCPPWPFQPKDGPGSLVCPHPLLASLSGPPTAL